MRKVIFTLCVIIPCAVFSQQPVSITSVYNEYFSIDKVIDGENIYLSRTIDSVTKDCAFKDVFNENKYLFDYIMWHYAPSVSAENLKSIRDNDKLEEMYIERLITDSVFSTQMQRLEDRIINGAEIQDTFTIDQCLNVAVKFFYIRKGRRSNTGKICVGMNGIKDCQKIHYPMLEAFCFNSVFKHAFNDSRLWDDFTLGLKTVGKIDLGEDKEEQLLRQQGAMYMYMMQNSKLKQILLDEFEINKSFLPFIIVD